MAETLTFLLRQLASLRGTGLNWEITDDVLHFFISYRQFVRELPEEYRMENLQLETGVAETEG